LKVGFAGCKLDHAVFAGLRLKGTRFAQCSMRGVDLTGADLEQVALVQCDLQDAVFERTKLRDADLSTAVNLRLDPDANDLRGAHFSVDGALMLLSRYGIRVG
jgi:uncharacterized protein YjbI with pentapeptide repeats